MSREIFSPPLAKHGSLADCVQPRFCPRRVWGVTLCALRSGESNSSRWSQACFMKRWRSTAVQFPKLRKLEALAETELPTMILFETRGL